MSTTAELVEEIQQTSILSPEGNAAMEKLVRRYQDMLFSYVCAKIRDPFSANDLVQEVFIIALKKLHTVRNPALFGPWLRRIAFHECLHWLNYEKNNEDLPYSEDIGVHNHCETSLKENRREIMNAIEKLSGRNRIVTLLYYIQGHSVAQIAELLQVSEQTIRKRLERSRYSLSQELQFMIKDTFQRNLPSGNTGLLNKISLAASFDYAARLGQLSLVEAMLMDGIDVNEQDINGRTILHWAMQTGHREIIELLLKCGADPEIKDNAGKTPSDYTNTRA